MKLEEPKLNDHSLLQNHPHRLRSKELSVVFWLTKEEERIRNQGSEGSSSSEETCDAPSAYELVQGLVAKDGSFARAYVALSEHERRHMADHTQLTSLASMSGLWKKSMLAAQEARRV